MDDVSYEQRIQSQIAQYAETVDMHALPDAFHVWSHNYIRPGLVDVFGTGSIDECYALAILEASEATGSRPARVLSIGCGDGGVEIRVAKILLDRGLEAFQIVGADLSPILLGHFRDAVEREGLSAHFDLVEADLNRMEVPGRFDAIMANHSLHHIEGLEHLFDYSHERLRDAGIFVTCDMIGRNGHMRWPEAEAFIQALWPMLKPEQRYHAQLRRFDPDRFVDHDCSTAGFEGIRAQDILPLMLQRFHPYKFLGAGGVADLLLERSYGHGFDVTSEQDTAWIHFIARLNELLLDSGVVKPTWTMAFFTKEKRGEHFFRNRRALSCLRQPGHHPDWTAAALPTAA